MYSAGSEFQGISKRFGRHLINVWIFGSSQESPGLCFHLPAISLKDKALIPVAEIV
jgi:hypothetical protein